MKIKYESEDGKVSGYGDEGKAAVEAHESDPLARFNFPWEYSMKAMGHLNSKGYMITTPDYVAAATFFSKVAPLVRATIAQADISWHREWRTRKPEVFYYKTLIEMEQALHETLNG